MLERNQGLITGAGRGIGLEFVTQLLKEKSVHCIYAVTRKKTESKALCQLEVENLERLVVIEADITKNEGRIQLLKDLHQKTNRLDLIIHNAGVLLDGSVGQPLEKGKIVNEKDSVLEQTFLVNSITPVYLTQTLLPLLKNAESPKLINISSIMGSMEENDSGGYIAYRMSKAALNMFTKNMAIDFPEMTTVSMHPGWVKTQMGGENAAITSQVSVERMLKVILSLNREKSGSFLDYLGRSLPW